MSADERTLLPSESFPSDACPRSQSPSSRSTIAKAVSCSTSCPTFRLIPPTTPTDARLCRVCRRSKRGIMRMITRYGFCVLDQCCNQDSCVVYQYSAWHSTCTGSSTAKVATCVRFRGYMLVYIGIVWLLGENGSTAAEGDSIS